MGSTTSSNQKVSVSKQEQAGSPALQLCTVCECVVPAMAQVGPLLLLKDTGKVLLPGLLSLSFCAKLCTQLFFLILYQTGSQADRPHHRRSQRTLKVSGSLLAILGPTCCTAEGTIWLPCPRAFIVPALWVCRQRLRGQRHSLTVEEGTTCKLCLSYTPHTER